MARPKIPNHRKQNLIHKKRVEGYTSALQKIFDDAATEMARLASLSDIDSDTPFSFMDYPLTKGNIDRIIGDVVNTATATIYSATSNEWKESNLVQDLVADKVLNAYVGTDRNGEEYTRYYQTNPDALEAFLQRKENGMNLSDRIWRIGSQYREELEESISAAIAPGTSAMELAAQVKKYLNEPEKRFRRVRDKFGKLQLSSNAKAYHPGQGVYRSSARNAQRLARTEINMAYRTAEQVRWQQFDFVVGYEVKTTQNGHHEEDICDILAGKYPKNFSFKGWHPNCMCYCIPILKTEEEFWADDSEDSTESVNEVKDVPEGFKEWIKDNKDRIEAAEKRGKVPYFIKDNKDEVEGILRPNLTLEQIQANGWIVKIMDKKGKLDMNSFLNQEWMETVFSKLNFPSLKQQLDEAVAAIGLNQEDFGYKMVWSKHRDSIRLVIDGPKLSLERKFLFVDGKLNVEHSFFELDEEMQGKGFSKKILSIFFEQYQKAGVNKIELQANLDVGGYTWARYGFKCDKQDVKNIINSYISPDIRKAALEIVEDYFKTKDSNSKFQMRELTGYPWSKDLLLGAKWNGELLLGDEDAVKIFKSYLKS